MRLNLEKDGSQLDAPPSGRKPKLYEKDQSSVALEELAGSGTVLQQLCYGLAMAFLQTPLRRFGFRTPEITRFDSTEVYIGDRVTDASAYAQLFEDSPRSREEQFSILGVTRGICFTASFNLSVSQPLGLTLLPLTLN